jgi:CO/xanthine dehydrogenase Mo-binding subunit
MEPRGVLAEWDAAQGRMTVLGAAKVPFFNRDTLAAMLGLSSAQVDLIENDVGGGFGARGEFYPEDFLIPFAARHVGRPVRWLEDRREHLIAMNHARQADCEVEIACRSDGTILGLRGEVFVDLGAYVRTNGLIQPRTLAQSLTGPYRVPNVRMTSTALLTNKTPTGTYRAPGRYEGSFFCERIIELAARDLGIDSAEMRRRNLIGAGEMRTGCHDWSRSVRPAIPSATAATTAKPSNAASPSSAGRKSVGCKAARSTGATTALLSPALSRAGEPVRRRRRGSTSRQMARCRFMSARLRSGRASKR